MIRVEVIEQFTLKDYEKIKDSIKRKSIDIKGTLFVGDTFECDEEMCSYLMGKNELGKTVVKVIEVEPEKDEIKERHEALLDLNDSHEGVIPLANLKELNKDNTKLYINNQEYSFTKCFTPKNAGIYIIQLEFKFQLTNCSYMFYNCSNFNQSVNFPDTVTNFYDLFSNCRNYNKTVNIPDSVTNCAEMFYNCMMFNQSVNIPNSVKNCYQMFYNCISLNQPIIIPEYATSCESMFYNCQSFNQPVNIPNTSDYAALAYMFYNCYNFNQHVNIPNGVISCYEMFSNCFNLNQEIIFPASVNNMCNACWNCLNISDIYIYCNNNVNVTNLVGGDRINAARNVNIHCANLAIINKTSYGVYPSISWDANLYNSKYKIQLTTVM